MFPNYTDHDENKQSRRERKRMRKRDFERVTLQYMMDNKQKALCITQVAQEMTARRWASACTSSASIPNSWARSTKRCPLWSLISLDDWVWVDVAGAAAGPDIVGSRGRSLSGFETGIDLDEAKPSSFVIWWLVKARKTNELTSHLESVYLTLTINGGMNKFSHQVHAVAMLCAGLILEGVEAAKQGFRSG
jgi:hypothetical protein